MAKPFPEIRTQHMQGRPDQVLVRLTHTLMVYLLQLLLTERPYFAFVFVRAIAGRFARLLTAA